MSHGVPETSKKTRVLLNGLHAKSGGGVTYLRNILPRIAADPRLELHLFIHANQYPLFVPVDERVRLHLLDFEPSLWRMLLWEQLSLPIVARVMAADVTFSPANFGPIFAPGPVIVLRNALAVAGSERRLNMRLYWAGLGAMTAICLLGCRRAIAVSNYARRNLTFHLPARILRKVVVVYHGVDEAFSPADKSLNSDDGPGFLLAVGDIYVQKNLLTLIAAFARVREAVPGIVLKIAGRPIDNGYFQQLEQKIAEYSLDDHVVFLGDLDTAALTALYRSCAAFVFPSTVETFGNPLAEAMACGAPVACSDATAIPEVVGDAAVLFNPYDTDDMTRAILSVLCDPSLAEMLRERGLARAQMFSWELTAQLTGDVLSAAAGGQSAKRLDPSGETA